MLGKTREELVGKDDFAFFPPPQAEFFQAKDRETLARGAVVDIAEEPIETATGTRWLHTKKVPLMGDDGQPRFLLGISADITERKQTAAALRAAVDAAESANRELESFSYSVAHDLRAPLRSIDGFSQALMEDCGERLDERGHEHLRRVRAAAQRMGDLIDSLLAIARIARAELRWEPVDLSGLAATAVEELRALSPGREVTVTIEPSLRTRGDPRLLRVVLDNLLGNAFKFTATRPEAHIQFASAVEGDERAFFVKDDGVGFDPRYANHLFRVFQRLHSAPEFPGTGIGLATVQRVIQRHGGRIWARGEPEAGATFYFTLGKAS
jgi:PAS domain S-box-containing protein